MKHKNFFVLATFILLLTVILGAFGAHGLKPYMVEGGPHTFQTGIRYQFYHGLVIFVLLILDMHSPIASLKRIVYFFSGGNYLLFQFSVFVIGQIGSAGIIRTSNRTNHSFGWPVFHYGLGTCACSFHKNT